MLSGEARTGKIFGGGRRTHREGARVASRLCLAGVAALNFEHHILRNTCALEECADLRGGLLAGPCRIFGQGDNRRLQRVGLDKGAVCVGGDEETGWHREASARHACQ